MTGSAGSEPETLEGVRLRVATTARAALLDLGLDGDREDILERLLAARRLPETKAVLGWLAARAALADWEGE